MIARWTHTTAGWRRAKETKRATGKCVRIDLGDDDIGPHISDFETVLIQRKAAEDLEVPTANERSTVGELGSQVVDLGSRGEFDMDVADFDTIIIEQDYDDGEVGDHRQSLAEHNLREHVQAESIVTKPLLVLSSRLSAGYRASLNTASCNEFVSQWRPTEMADRVGVEGKVGFLADNTLFELVEVSGSHNIASVPRQRRHVEELPTANLCEYLPADGVKTAQLLPTTNLCEYLSADGVKTAQLNIDSSDESDTESHLNEYPILLGTATSQCKSSEVLEAATDLHGKSERLSRPVDGMSTETTETETGVLSQDDSPFEAHTYGSANIVRETSLLNAVIAGGETRFTSLQSEVSKLRMAAVADVSSLRAEMAYLVAENKRLQDLAWAADRNEVDPAASSSRREVDSYAINANDAQLVTVSKTELERLERLAEEFVGMKEELQNCRAHAEDLAVELTLEKEVTRGLRHRADVAEDNCAALEIDLSLVLDAKQSSETALLQVTQQCAAMYKPTDVYHCVVDSEALTSR